MLHFLGFLFILIIAILIIGLSIIGSIVRGIFGLGRKNVFAGLPKLYILRRQPAIITYLDRHDRRHPPRRR